MIFLCLGNSLTAGTPGHDPSPDGISPGYGNVESQYQFWLKIECLDFFEKNLGQVDDFIVEKLEFINKGVSGELTGELLQRIELEIENAIFKPDYCIIIEGTNDLGWNIPVEEIFLHIKQMHEISHSMEIDSIGATIPPVLGEESYPIYKENKRLINEKLIHFFEDMQIPHADLYKKMIDEKGNLKAELAYLDGLHFSVRGYQEMGKIIFNDVIHDLLEHEFF